MTDLEEFKVFFDCMGVAYRVSNDFVTKGHFVTVAQAIFIFDKDGRYIQVEDDEMGGVYPREK